MLGDTIEDRREKVILKEPEGWMEQKQKRLANKKWIFSLLKDSTLGGLFF